MNIITDLEEMRKLAEEEDDENLDFRIWLKRHGDSRIDRYVKEIFLALKDKIDCTKCSNCCHELSLYLSNTNIAAFCKTLNLTKNEFLEKHTEFDEFENCHLLKSPCPCLKNGLCTIYDSRPRDCKDYPNLHKRDFCSRLSQIMASCHICPLVFNTVRILKQRLHFR